MVGGGPRLNRNEFPCFRNLECHNQAALPHGITRDLRRPRLVVTTHQRVFIGRVGESLRRLPHAQGVNIALAVQHANDVDGVFVQKVINADGLKPRNGPGTQILKLRTARTIARTHKGMLAQRLNGTPDGVQGSERISIHYSLFVDRPS